MIAILNLLINIKCLQLCLHTAYQWIENGQAMLNLLQTFLRDRTLAEYIFNDPTVWFGEIIAHFNQAYKNRD